MTRRGVTWRRRWLGLLSTVVLLCVGAGTVAGCTPEYARERDQYVIAGGNPAGVYSRYGTELAAAMTAELPISVETSETQGSVDNLRRVAAGEAFLGFAQGDTAADAVVGSGEFARPLPIRAVARVYDEYVHIVVPEDSPIMSLSDLAGRPVSLGSRDSGVQVIAGRLFEATGLSIDDVQNAALGVDDSITALREGKIEAFFWVGALPTPGIEQLAEGTPIRMVAIGPDTIARVNEGHAGVYRVADFPSGSYGVERHVTTMTVPNYLVTSAAAPEALIADALDVLFRSRATIAGEVRAAEFLDRRQAIFTAPVALHSGASRYYVDSRR
ncbi:TAXI family TRAP transporter solute-binding subunit [Leucobacter sp. 7(1)]|uniref:TAXI family TRAP transporter solute-binding subunit n=1 Tax=Leucobacter sp. 7(1) TaxID=1255613 RepID=UPI000B350822|nr:TAXI family TRAP transporter solute-binding subunit [Leucobacter sp. 7(1)]